MLSSSHYNLGHFGLNLLRHHMFEKVSFEPSANGSHLPLSLPIFIFRVMLSLLSPKLLVLIFDLSFISSDCVRVAGQPESQRHGPPGDEQINDLDFAVRGLSV